MGKHNCIKCYQSSVICLDIKFITVKKMAEKMQSRSCTTKELLNEKFVEVLELKSTGKLPTGSIVIGRMLYLCRKNIKGQKKAMSREDASKIVAKELILEWIKKNVYPMHETTVAEKICK